MVAFVHVGMLSDVLSDIRDWLDAGRELLVDLIDYVEADEGEEEADEGEEEADEGEEEADEGEEEADEGDDDEGYDEGYDAGYDDGHGDSVAAIIGAVGDYVLDNPTATVSDVITFLKGEF